jgi:drug/metabolite transporter (DMT)-like permease
MARNLIWTCAKGLAMVVMAYAGYFVGFALAYYLGDRGDVGTVATALVTIPVAMISGAILCWFGMRRIERKISSKIKLGH